MMDIIVLIAAMLAPPPEVTGLSVTPVAGRTEIVILVDDRVRASHFMMDDGRLVIDLAGVSNAPSLDIRDFNRGGVRELRVAPFLPGVARVVFALERRLDYQYTREGDRLRISFANTAGAFQPWNTRLAAPAAAAVVTPAVTQGQGVAAQFETQTARVVPTTRLPTTAPAALQQPQERPITARFSNEPLINVIGLFADYSGRTILAAQALHDNLVTGEVTDVPWDVALAALLETNGMTLRIGANNILMVAEAAQAGAAPDEPLITRTFRVEYTNADSVQRAIAGLLTPEVGRVTVNTATNSLLVTDIQSVIDQIGPILQELDVQTPQVDIQATIAFIDRTATEARGVIYDLKDSRGNQLNSLVQGGADLNNDGVLSPDELSTDNLVLLGGNSIAALGNANYPVAGPSLQLLTTLVLGRHSLIAFIEALQSVSLSDIQAKPLVRAMDHRRATIQVGEQTPVRVIDAGAAGAGEGAPRATVEFRNTGIILEVTPHVTGTNQVVLEMRAERSGLAAATGDVGVVFQTQNAETHVLVEDGETVVIGGLTIVEKTRVRVGIPLLMDLPVIGALFRNTTEQENKKDLMIMVTPHIVR